MLLIDPANGHHRHQDVELTDRARITSKEGFNQEWAVGLDNDIDPGTRDIHAGKVVRDLIDLGDNNPIVKSRGLHNGRGIFRTEASVKVPSRITLLSTDQGNLWEKINKQARIEFNIRMNGTNLQLLILDELGHAQALFASIGEIDGVRDPSLKQITMLWPTDTPYYQVQIMDVAWIQVCQAAREKVRLLLIITLKRDHSSWGKK